MRKEIESWWKQAEEDYSDARYNFEGKRYKTATFLCQQAVEKAFKAILLKKTGQIRKIHDLVQLGKDIEIPEHIMDVIKELSLAYIYSRYPDVPQNVDLREKASQFLKVAKGVLQWAEESLSRNG